MKKFYHSFIVFFALIMSGPLYSQIRIFNTSASFTVPPAITSITVEAWGAGGGGGGGNGNNSSGGGGGGAYTKRVLPVNPAQVYTITIGAGGSSNVAGGNSSVKLGTETVLIANGGGAGQFAGAPGSGGVASTGGIGLVVSYAGGNGGEGTGRGGIGNENGGAGGGGSAGTGSAGGIGGSPTSRTGAAGGAAGLAGDRGKPGSIGGQGGIRPNGPFSYNNAVGGDPGLVPGAGGGGRSSSGTGIARDASGGAGANGRVIITYTNSADTDGDGVPNVEDLDADNDGILNTAELYCDQTIAPNGAFPTRNTNIPTTGQTGQYVKQLLFFNWDGVTLGGTTTGATRFVDHNGVRYTATITNFKGASMVASQNLTYNGPEQMFGKHYSFAATGLKPVFKNTANSSNNNSFNVLITATKDGVSYPVEVVVFDPETTNSGTSDKTEQLQYKTSASNFVLLEKLGPNDIGTNITGEGTKIITYLNTQTSGVNALYSTTGYSPSLFIETVLKNSQQGAGFAVRLYCDTNNGGVPDFLDLDSDSDGCSDANEYYNSATADGVDDNQYYGEGDPPSVDATGKVIGALYVSTTSANVRIATNTSITTHPVNRTIDSGTSTTFSVVAASVNTSTFLAGVPNYTLGTNNVGNIKYQWQLRSKGGSTWSNVSNGGVYSGATEATLTITAAPFNLNENQYRAIVTVANNVCTRLVSETRTLTIIPPLCYNDPNITGPGADTKHGITLLQRAGADNGNWPMVRKGAHTVLESNTEGFVITRISTSGLSNITTPIEGMMVYDTTVNCLKIYTVDTITPINTGWKCFSTPSCPTEFKTVDDNN